MIKVESNMLILDTSFSKQDAEAINHFVEIARLAERESMIKVLEARVAEAGNIGIFYQDGLISAIKILKDGIK
jgi:hypothetical protein